MSTLDLSLTDELRAFVESEAAQAGYGSPGQYIEAVLRELWRRSAKTELEIKLAEGMSSGDAIEATPQFWEGLKARVRQR